MALGLLPRPKEATLLSIPLHDVEYEVAVYRRVTLPPEAPRIVMVSSVDNPAALGLLTTCLTAVQHFTPEPHELWVVDNNSDVSFIEGLADWPDLNLALSRTEPVEPPARAVPGAAFTHGSQQQWGSYANAVALEIAAHLIDPDTRYLMTMHMDSAPCRRGWLSYLLSKLDDRVRAAGVRMDRSRVPAGVLHVLGYVVDFRLFRQLGLDFWPDLPGLDVGDRVTVALRQAGYDVFVCRNTLWEPELANRIPSYHLLRWLAVDRSLDDNDDVVFLHLGRGVRKASGIHRKGTLIDDYCEVLDRLMVD
jgi:hypothetical protein